jgi:hypothetical protein
MNHKQAKPFYGNIIDYKIHLIMKTKLLNPSFIGSVLLLFFMQGNYLYSQQLSIDGGLSELTRSGEALRLSGSGSWLSFYQDTAFNGYLQHDSVDLHLANITSTGSLTLRTNNLTRMTIKSDGKIGIGTIAPLDELHVVGNARVSHDLILNGYSYFGGDDDGVIKSNPDLISSDIVLASNDALVIVLNTDNDTTDLGQFEIRDGDNNKVFQTWDDGHTKVSSTNDGEPAISGTVTYSSGTLRDEVGVYGRNTVDQGFGIGGDFDGGYIGVRGNAKQTGSSNKFGVYGVAGGTGLSYGIYGVYATGSSGTNYAGYFAGDVHVTGTFTNPSDNMFKTGVKESAPLLDQINSLKVRDYSHKAEYVEKMNLSEKPQTGFIAQELQTVFPKLVTENKHANPEQKGEVTAFLGINYLGLIPILTKGIQELSAENEELRNRLDNIEALLRDLTE